MKGKLFFVVLLCCCTLFPCHAEIRIISPAPGVWGNRQVLAFEEDGASKVKGGDVFYSLDGSDSMAHGFAYDGPVLLDKDGEVTLDVSVQERNADGRIDNGKNHKQTISYTVKETDIPTDPFLVKAIKTGFIDVVSGDSISIPSEYRYSIDGGGEEKGRIISCAKENILFRMARLALDDGKGHRYSFLLRVLPNEGEKAQPAEKVPFSITSWSNIRFDDARRIYKIDDSTSWLPHTGAKEAMAIDRTKAHTIYWQSAAYEKGNEISSFYLPPIPHLYTSEGKAGEVSIAVKDADYAIGILLDGALSLRKCAVLDTVCGDEASGIFPVRMYYKGLYQGGIAIPYNIDRCRPPAPVIESSVVNGGITRGDADVAIAGAKDCALYVSVDDGKYVKISANPSGNNGIAADNIARKIVHFAGGKDEEHKIASYCADKMGNVSGTVNYSVTIDKYRYFVDEAKGKIGALGLKDDPCASIEECIKQGGNAFHITVRGMAHITRSAVEKISSCDITIAGERGDEHLFIDGTLETNKKLSLQNLIVKRRADTKDTAGYEPFQGPLIASRGGVICIDGSEVFDEYAPSGIVIKTDGGALCIKNSGVTVNARISASAITSSDTDLRIVNSRISSSAMEGVCVSCFGGNAAIDNSILRNTGQRAHGIELFGTKGCITNNTLEAELKENGDAIYCDKKSADVHQSGNTLQGW